MRSELLNRTLLDRHSPAATAMNIQANYMFNIR